MMDVAFKAAVVLMGVVGAIVCRGLARLGFIILALVGAILFLERTESFVLPQRVRVDDKYLNVCGDQICLSTTGRVFRVKHSEGADKLALQDTVSGLYVRIHDRDTAGSLAGTVLTDPSNLFELRGTSLRGPNNRYLRGDRWDADEANASVVTLEA